MTLQKKMAHGTLWGLVNKIANQGVSLIVFVFVARLIGPKDYGLASICFVFLFVANLIVLGIADGIVSLEIRDTRRLSTLFWFIMAIGFSSTIICIAAAGQVAAFFEESRLRPLLQWFSLVIACYAASVVPGTILYAEMRFRAFTAATMFASPLSAAIGVMMEVKCFCPFSISIQQLSLYLILNVFYWRDVKWRPAFL